MIFRSAALACWASLAVVAQSPFPVAISSTLAGATSVYVQGIESSPTSSFAAISDFYGASPVDCDGTVVFSHACFWRVSGDPGLSQFYDSGTPGDQGGITITAAPTGDAWTARWPDVDNRGVLDASWSTQIETFGPRSALVSHTWSLTNTSAAPVTFEFVAYSDLDFGFAFDNKTTQFSTSDRHIVVNDPAVPSACPGCVEFWGDQPASWEIAAWPLLEFKLTRPNFNGLSNSGLPFGVDDYTGAMGWTATVQPGATWTVLYSHGRSALQCSASASWSNYGTGDAGITMTPRSLPLLGAALDIDVVVSGGAAATEVLFGLQPLSIQVPGCSQVLLVDPIVGFGVPIDAAGNGLIDFPPVCDPQFCGVTIHMQSWVLDPAVPCLPLRHSDGLALTFGRL